MIRKSHIAAASPSGTFKTLAAAALGAAALACAPAQAGVIGFEGYYGPVEGTQVYTESDFNLGFYANVAGGGAGSFVGEFIDGTDPTYCVNMACPVNNPGMYYGALNDSYIDITSTTNRQRFKVKSLDASFIGASPALNSYPAVTGLLRLQGIRVDGSSALQAATRQTRSERSTQVTNDCQGDPASISYRQDNRRTGRIGPGL